MSWHNPVDLRRQSNGTKCHVVSKVLPDQIFVARSKQYKYFLEDPNGVGATTNRPYMSKFMVSKYCFWCSEGAGVCLGQSCMGPKKTQCYTEARWVPVKVDSGSDLPVGLGRSSASTMIEQKKTDHLRLNISAWQYPCYFPPRGTKVKYLKTTGLTSIKNDMVKVKSKSVSRGSKNEEVPTGYVQKRKSSRRTGDQFIKKKKKAGGKRCDRPVLHEVPCQRKRRGSNQIVKVNYEERLDIKETEHKLSFTGENNHAHFTGAITTAGLVLAASDQGDQCGGDGGKLGPAVVHFRGVEPCSKDSCGLFIEFSGTSAKDAEELIDKLCERITVTTLNPYREEASHTGLSLNVALNKNEHNLKRLLLSGDIETNPGSGNFVALLSSSEQGN